VGDRDVLHGVGVTASVLNFAYGSNTLVRRLRARAPSARPVARAVLRAHCLCWHKVGQDGSGKCDIVATDAVDERVHGVLYELAAIDKTLLDAAEGLGTGYGEKCVTVHTDAGDAQAWVYYALRTDPALLPFSWYKTLVVAGACEHALPPRYVEALQAVPAVQDRDTARHARYVALALSTLAGC
jgi:AIG2-like family